MNFLAHLHLAGCSPESRLGNLLGDFVKGRPDRRFSEAIWQGIMMHRHIDAFTDSHPEWKKSKARLEPGRRRFAGIIIDIFYDHFLARHWDRFSRTGESLDEFIETCHADLISSADPIPANAAGVLERMIRDRWLGSYGRAEGIDRALVRVSRRSRMLEPVRGSIVELENHYGEMERDFLAFYPDAIVYAAALRDADLL